jgi:hypothetical protein
MDVSQVKPLCDLCIRAGIFTSIMRSYQATDAEFSPELGVPYHCDSENHDRAYHGYDGYTSRVGQPAGLCRYCDHHGGNVAMFITQATSRSEVIFQCPNCGDRTNESLPGPSARP